MKCDRVKRLLPGYLDGALQLGAGSETHLMIGRHLELCGGCREELQSYLALFSLMSRVDRPAPPRIWPCGFVLRPRNASPITPGSIMHGGPARARS